MTKKSKTVVKKTSVKKPAPKNVSTKKPVAKKSTLKKPLAKKVSTKKTVSKNVVSKKSKPSTTQRKKVISPHTKKKSSEKLNRNSHITKKYAAKNVNQKAKKATLNYADPQSVKKHMDNTNPNNFKNRFFNDPSFLRFFYYPLLILFIVMVVDFILQLVVYTFVDPAWISAAKDSMFFMCFGVFLMAVEFGCYIYLGYSGAKHNYRFSSVFRNILYLVLFFILLKFILTFISFSTFLQPYLSLLFSDYIIKQLYLSYLLLLILINSTIYLLIAVVTYLLFFKVNFIKL